MIRLASPDIRAPDLERVVEILRGGDLVQGVWVRRFEEALCGFTGVPHCAVMSSCTAALHVTLLAIGVKPGDAVLVPAFTFPATANAVEHVGARVVLCDVDPTTYVLTPERIEATLRGASGIRAIVLVHEFGYPVAVRAVAALARAHSLSVIEDAACALGTVADTRPPGHFSDAACYSFHPRKAVTTGEGGAVVSSDAGAIERMRRLRNHGIQPTESGVMDFVDAGLNYRMTEFQAALGLAQLERFHDELAKKRVLAQSYLSRLAHRQDLTLPHPHRGHSWQSFMVVLDQRHDRNSVRLRLRERGVESNIGAQALNSLTYFRRRYGVSDDTCPVAATLFRRGLVLPLHGKLAPEDVETVCDRLEEVLDGAGNG